MPSRHSHHARRTRARHTKHGWTGYTFDENLFGAPADMLADMHAKGLYVAANLHDADGISPWEAQHAAAAAALGLGSQAGKLAFTLTNESYAFALEDIVLRPVEQVFILYTS